MIVGDYSLRDLRRELKGAGVRIRTGPVVSRILSSLPTVAEGIALHYAKHSIEPNDGFADFHVSIHRPYGLRRWYRPQVLFDFDGNSVFSPLPVDQAFPMLEWGLNWCISSQLHKFLIIHAAGIELGGRAAIFPAPSGSGKSTLCAGLVCGGWRLLTDELTLLDRVNGLVTPLARPVSLKNASIDAIRKFAPTAVFGPSIEDTAKGRVAHMQPPSSSVIRANEPAKPAWVIIPKFVADAAASLTPLSKAKTLMRLIDCAFNYNVHGRAGFNLLADLVERCDCFEFAYSDLVDANRTFESLASNSKALHNA